MHPTASSPHAATGHDRHTTEDTVFSDGSAAGTLHVGADGVIRHDGWEWTPDQARDVAEQWLAAAEHADKMNR